MYPLQVDSFASCWYDGYESFSCSGWRGRHSTKHREAQVQLAGGGGVTLKYSFIVSCRGVTQLGGLVPVL